MIMVVERLYFRTRDCVVDDGEVGLARAARMLGRMRRESSGFGGVLAGASGRSSVASFGLPPAHDAQLVHTRPMGGGRRARCISPDALPTSATVPFRVCR